jgi:hypothetical protein
MSEKSFAQRDNADFSSKQSAAKSASQAIASTSQTSSDADSSSLHQSKHNVALRIFKSDGRLYCLSQVSTIQ